MLRNWSKFDERRNFLDALSPPRQSLQDVMELPLEEAQQLDPEQARVSARAQRFKGKLGEAYGELAKRKVAYEQTGIFPQYARDESFNFNWVCTDDDDCDLTRGGAQDKLEMDFHIIWGGAFGNMSGFDVFQNKGCFRREQRLGEKIFKVMHKLGLRPSWEGYVDQDITIIVVDDVTIKQTVAMALHSRLGQRSRLSDVSCHPLASSI